MRFLILVVFLFCLGVFVEPAEASCNVYAASFQTITGTEYRGIVSNTPEQCGSYTADNNPGGTGQVWTVSNGSFSSPNILSSSDVQDYLKFGACPPGWTASGSRLCVKFSPTSYSSGQMVAYPGGGQAVCAITDTYSDVYMYWGYYSADAVPSHREVIYTEPCDPPPPDGGSGTDSGSDAPISSCDGNFVCECMESATRAVNSILNQILSKIQEIIEALNRQEVPTDSPPVLPVEKPVLDTTEIEQAENPLQCGYQSLFNKFPFDIMGDLNSPAANTCPAVFLLAREFEVCWLLDLVKVFKYPLIIGFLIRILVFL